MNTYCEKHGVSLIQNERCMLCERGIDMNTNDPVKTTKQWDGLWLATFGDYDLGDAVGTGATEAQAVHDLYLWADVEMPVSVFVGHDSEGMARYITNTI